MQARGRWPGSIAVDTRGVQVLQHTHFVKHKVSGNGSTLPEAPTCVASVEERRPLLESPQGKTGMLSAWGVCVLICLQPGPTDGAPNETFMLADDTHSTVKVGTPPRNWNNTKWLCQKAAQRHNAHSVPCLPSC
jgi:hypothetical protein